MTVGFHYHFHPVGQGLFSSGCLYVADQPLPKFLWVYDCGSSTIMMDSLWRTKICDLKRFVRNKPTIDLLTLSHFDNDHINGVSTLLKEFQIDTLILPYASLADRLLVAFGENISMDDKRMGFYVDPIRYLRELPGSEIGQIVFIGEDSGGDVYSALSRSTDFPVKEDESWKLTIPMRADANLIMEDEFGSGYSSEIVVNSGQSFTVNGLWEFCPYNQPREDISAQFFHSHPIGWAR